MSKEVATVCYSHRDHQPEEEVLRMARERADRKRRKRPAKRDGKERAAKEDRGLVKA